MKRNVVPKYNNLEWAIKSLIPNRARYNDFFGNIGRELAQSINQPK